MSFGLGFGFPRLGGAKIRPAVAFDFTSGSQTLDPRITFSRGTNATLIGSNGSLQYAPHNLLTYSEQFDNAVWVKARTSISANTTTAPDGTVTADKLVEDATNNTHICYFSSFTFTAQAYTASFYLKAAERTKAEIVAGSASTAVGLGFDLTAGTTFACTVSGTVAPTSSSIVNVGAGWWRCSITWTAIATVGIDPRVYVNDGTTTTYTGDGTSGIYVWGAQLNVGALQPYYSTTVKNLLGFTQEFDNAAWTKVGANVAANSLPYSEQFDNVGWIKSAASVTPNSFVAPDSSLTADVLIPDTASTDHRVSASIGSVVSGNIFTLSVYAKPSGYNFIRLSFGNTAGGGYTFFNVSNGTIGATSSMLSNQIQSIGNGWYRCTVTRAASATGNLNADIYVTSADSEFTWAGNGTGGVAVWGAQINVGTSADLYQRTEAAARALPYTAPDGSPTADKLVEDVSTGPHYIFPATSDLLAVGQIVTLSIYAKAAERTFLQLIFTGVGPGSSNLIAGFDLAAGIAGTPSAGTTSSVVDVGNGWYRCRFTITVSTSTTATRQIRISQNSSSTPSSYTGDGTSGIYVWGAQVSDSASLDPYKYNPGAAPANAAYYGPRFNYEPGTLAPLGLLIEEARTNSIRNNTMQGAVAGTPGTLPTNWAVSVITTTGITSSVVGTGTEDGITYIDISLAGTASGAGSVDFTFEAANGIAAATGQVWGASLYWKLAAGSLTGLSNPVFYTYEYNSSVGFVAAPNAGNPALPTTAALRTQRFTGAATLGGGATTAFVRPLIKLNIADTATVNVTLRIGMPQFELGAFATSVIPTTTTALTRAADIPSMTGANFSNWYNPLEGTVFVEASTMSALAAGMLTHAISDNTFNNSIYGNFSSGNTYRGANVIVGGVAQTGDIGSFTGLTTSNPNKDAFAYKLNSFAESCNGATTRTDLLGTVPVVDRLYLGTNWSGNGNFLNGHISSFAYYPARLSNDQLQNLTTFTGGAWLFDSPELSGQLLTSGLM